MPNLPDELAEKLTTLMGEIAEWVCNESGKPQVLTMFHCIHDKDLGAALMTIDIRVGEGLKWAHLKGDGPEGVGPISEPPDKVAEDLIAQMMKAAKEKGGEKKE